MQRVEYCTRVPAYIEDIPVYLPLTFFFQSEVLASNHLQKSRLMTDKHNDKLLKNKCSWFSEQLFKTRYMSKMTPVMSAQPFAFFTTCPWANSNPLPCKRCIPSTN